MLRATVRIGVSPLLWTNDDDPALGGDTPLETCLREARLAGYAGIELGGKFPRDPEKLRDAVAAHGLELVSGWYSGNVLVRGAHQELAPISDHAGLLRPLGCEVLVFCDVTGAVHRTAQALSER